jgi:hypothetical protein
MLAHAMDKFATSAWLSFKQPSADACSEDVPYVVASEHRPMSEMRQPLCHKPSMYVCCRACSNKTSDNAHHATHYGTRQSTSVDDKEPAHPLQGAEITAVNVPYWFDKPASKGAVMRFSRIRVAIANIYK